MECLSVMFVCMLLVLFGLGHDSDLHCKDGCIVLTLYPYTYNN
jgi:hypothetical protein